ncbi:MAG: ABC transporter substrate-binding protein [Pseudomonadota bacterium]
MTKLTRRQTMGLMGAAAAAPLLSRPAYANTAITVGALRFTSHAASFVAFERGYFDDAGLDVNFEFFQAAQPMALAIAAGDADFAVTAVSGALISLAERGATKVIGGALSEEQGIDGQKIVVSNAALADGVDSPSALGGRTWAVTQAGSSFHYMGSKISQAEGVEVEFQPLQGVGNIIGALRSDQVDAWSIVPHIAKPLDASGAVHIIGDVADYLPNYQVTTVFTSSDNAANERAKSEAFIAAFSRGAADFNAALVDKTQGEDGAEEMVQLIHKYVYTDRELDAARPAIVNGAMRINEGAALNTTSLENQMNWFKSEGLIDESASMDNLVDGSYVETM